MQSRFRVQVSKDYLVFASAHFITFRGHQCETLHGHNYRVGVTVEGSVDGTAVRDVGLHGDRGSSRLAQVLRSPKRCFTLQVEQAD